MSYEKHLNKVYSLNTSKPEWMKVSLLARYVIVLLFVVLSSHAINAQNTLDFQHFTTEDGLSHNYINSIYQDSDGFIWIATRNGVCRYDGYTFEPKKTTLIDLSVVDLFSTDVLESEKAEMWSFGGGVCGRYNGKTFKVYSDSYEFAYPDNKGNIWFIKDSKLICLELNNIEVIDDKSPSNANKLRLIFRERENKIWVFEKFTQQQIINSSKGFYYSYEIVNPYPEANKYKGIYVDSNNILWISTSNNGLLRFDPEKEQFKEYNYQNDYARGLASNIIGGVCEIDSAHLWIGTSEGLNIMDQRDGSIQLFRNDLSNPKSLSDNIVTSFLKDRSGNIFVGTRYGLNLLRERKFKHTFVTEEENSILSNNVHGFLEDEQGNTWIITSGGLSMLDVNTNFLTNYRVDKELPNALKGPPISIISDGGANMWIGTWYAGLYYFDKAHASFKSYTQDLSVANSISDNRIMTLFRDSRNRIWVGTWGGGVNLFNPADKSFTVFSSEQNGEKGLSDNEVSCFAEDKFGRLWVGTLNGLNLLEDEKNKVFRQFMQRGGDSSSISYNQISTLHTSGAHLWVGTNFGLNKLNLVDYSVEKIMIGEGLPSNQIKAITEDDQGCLWISTNKGLAKIIFKPGEKQQIERIFAFTPSDGLQDNEFLERSVYKKLNGELLFGGTNGFNTFHPDHILIDSTAPVCKFTKLFVDEKEVLVGENIYGTIPLQERLSKTEKIRLSYKQNSFAIEYAGLHFSNPGEISYRYMLQGFDENWKTTDSKNRIASYTNINKGKYKLLVNAANSNGYWGKKPISINIEVVPPFWKTSWFRVLLYLSLAILVILVIEIRTNIIKNQKIRLEKTVKERTSEILKQKNSIEKQKEEIKIQADQIRQMNELLKKHNIELKDNIESLSKARVMQKLLDYKEFNKIFKGEDECREYLIELKWGKGYHCARCNGNDFSVEDNQARRCKKCNYKESTTAGTIFHHLRFPLNKAFYILIVTSTGRKINISELSRTLDLRLKTTWNFHNKVKDEMKRLKAPIKSDKGWTSLIITSPTGKRDFGY